MLESLGISRAKQNIALALLACVAMAFALSGCDAFRVPSREEFATLEQREIALRDEVRELVRVESEQLAQRATLDGQAVAVDAERTRLAEQYAQLAQQLAAATRDGLDEVADAYRFAMRNVEIEQAAIADNRARLDAALASASEIIAAAQRRRVESESEIERVGQQIDDLYDDAVRKQESLAGGVNELAQQVDAFVPGAGAVGSIIAGNIAPTGAVGAFALAGVAEFKRRRDRRRMAEVVASNNVAGVITNDKSARRAAESLQDEKTRKLFDKLRVEAKTIERKMAEGMPVSREAASD